MNAEELVEQDVLSQERAMLQTIGRIAQLEMARKQALDAVASANGIGDTDEHIKALREQIRQWMALNDRTELVDGETGIEVTLRTSYDAPTYDVRTLVQSPEGRAALLEAAEQVGMVQIVHKSVEAAEKTGASFIERLAMCRMPGGVRSMSLVFRNRGKWG